VATLQHICSQQKNWGKADGGHPRSTGESQEHHQDAHPSPRHIISSSSKCFSCACLSVHNQISAKSKNNIYSLYNDVTPAISAVPFIRYIRLLLRLYGQVDMQSREQITLQNACPKTLPNFNVTHAFILAPVSSHQQDLSLTRNIHLYFPSLLLLSLASFCSKAKEIPEPTSSEKEYRLKFSFRFCICQHRTLILGNIRDYRETESSASAGRLENYE